jgi:predicted nucleotidyltransferase
MRLKEYEVSAIKQSVHKFDSEAKIFLFGSRVDDSKKGGDIDLFILSSRINNRDKRKIKLNIYDKIGEQKIDLIVAQDITTAFQRIAATEGVQL